MCRLFYTWPIHVSHKEHAPVRWSKRAPPFDVTWLFSSLSAQKVRENRRRWRNFAEWTLNRATRHVWTHIFEILFIYSIELFLLCVIYDCADANLVRESIGINKTIAVYVWTRAAVCLFCLFYAFASRAWDDRFRCLFSIHDCPLSDGVYGAYLSFNDLATLKAHKIS